MAKLTFERTKQHLRVTYNLFTPTTIIVVGHNINDLKVALDTIQFQALTHSWQLLDADTFQATATYDTEADRDQVAQRLIDEGAAEAE